MARQVSLVKFKGKIGDLSFYKSDGDYQARMKGGPSKEQINSDPRFQRTKENGVEFGRAANVSKKLREQLNQGSDTKFPNRLTGMMNRILRADELNGRGDRQVITANLIQLTGLECNVNAKLSEVFFLRTRPIYDIATSEATLELPQMIAKNQIKMLNGATHVQVQLVATEFDAQNPEADAVATARSSYLDVGQSNASPSETLSLQLAPLPQPDSAVILLMGISYFQFVNGGYYPLSNGAYNALTFVQVILP